MKKLKKTEKKLVPKGPDLSMYRSGQETIAREYYILRDDVFDFLGVFNASASQHTNFADLQLSNEK